MDSPQSSLTCVSPADEIAACAQKEKEGDLLLSQVDPFLVEALQNPRHRLTVLRMEMDVQRFMQNPDQHQFEFQHFPTSYLRRAVHRVAQHYGLQTMVLDNIIDGSGKIAVRKTPESKYPAICLSNVPAKQTENEKSERVKIAIRPRLNKASQNDGTEQGVKKNQVRTVEERKEEYDRARARIFSSCNSEEYVYPQPAADGKALCLSRDESEIQRNIIEEAEKNGTKDCASRVAIFRDREKDRIDPDYDRSYDRYLKVMLPNQNFTMGPYNVVQPSYVQYEMGFPQLGQVPGAQTTLGYRSPGPIMNPFCAVGCNQTSRDPVYMHWASPAMLYAHSYEHFKHAVVQAPFYQQPLSFEYSQNH